MIELVKGVFGLCESPRLLWLQLREHILAAGVVECRLPPATFEISNKKGDLCGVLSVYVDNCFWAGAV